MCASPRLTVMHISDGNSVMLSSETRRCSLAVVADASGGESTFASSVFSAAPSTGPCQRARLGGARCVPPAFDVVACGPRRIASPRSSTFTCGRNHGSSCFLTSAASSSGVHAPGWSAACGNFLVYCSTYSASFFLTGVDALPKDLADSRSVSASSHDAGAESAALCFTGMA